MVPNIHTHLHTSYTQAHSFSWYFLFYFSHADGFVRNLAGPPHYFRSGTASRELEGQTSNENVTVPPAEGAIRNTVVSTTAIGKTQIPGKTSVTTDTIDHV